MHTTGSEALRSSRTLPGAVADGDPAAWAAVVERYGAVVDGRIRRFALQRADAEDVRQTTWMRLLEHARRLHTPEHLGGWLATVATRECLVLLRARRRGPVLDDDALARLVADLPDPADHLIAEELRVELERALGTLTERRNRLVRALFQSEPRPYPIIAAELELPIGSIGPTRARALKDLREELVGK
jgi:RNA polymerase sigma factor (sigma-70 family)